MNLSDLLNPYDRRARLYPVVIVVLPILVLLPALYGFNIASVASIAAACGMGFLLTRVGRDAGARIQEKLWASWGGAPTTQMLRHSDARLDRLTKARYHRILSDLLGLAMPSPQDELDNGAAADEIYRAATRRLIHATRSPARFRLLFNENVAYGFHRNGHGLRPIGVAVAVVCIAWVPWHAGFIILKPPFWSAARLSSSDVLPLIVSGAALLAWFTVFTEASLKRTAYAYAERLLECCDELAQEGIT